jgi:membrane-bound lytic murein transglycosylase D
MALRVWLLGTLASTALATAAFADPSQFPRPPELEPDIRFWQRIYSKVTTQGGLLHDDRDLSIVYEELHFEPASSWHERVTLVDAERSRFERLLRRLAAGPREGLEGEDLRVLALFPAGVSGETLAEAAEHVRFQLGQADRFREGLIRSGTWERHVEETLRREGLPPELSALPHVESSFNPRATSKVGAAGIWQFMRSTAKRWLRVDSTVDERLDPYKSTLAAAQFLNINYAILGSWPLALTAYNHGAGGMRHAREKMGTDDIVTIVRNYQSRTFGFASRNFYVSFLAALEIDRNPEKFFGRLDRAQGDTSHTVRLPAAVTVPVLEKALGADRESLRALNLSLLDPVWSGKRPVPRGFELHVPAGMDAARLAAKLGAALDTSRTHETSVMVGKGDTLDRIATTYGLRTAELAAYNDLADRALRPGTTLRIPPTAPAATKPPPPATVPPAASVEVPAEDTYVVKAGDSLSEIARRLGVSDKALMAQNAIRDPNFLYEGQKLRAIRGTEEAPVATPAPAPAPTPAAAVEPRPRTESARARPQPASREEAAETGPGLLPGVESAASADPGDYSVNGDIAIVQGAETLGHYAEWLGVTPARLRELNAMASGASLTLGRRLKLDLSVVDAAKFVARRTHYHQQLQDEFFQHWRITGQESHRLQSGESLWTLTRRSTVPVWLLRQYNPGVDFTTMRAGTEILLPKLEAVPPSGGDGAGR